MKASKEDISRLGRLKKRSDFLRVQTEGRRWTAKNLILQSASQPEGPGREEIRFGLTVSKRLSKSAVERNRIKRRLRAVAWDVLPACARLNMDYVLIGRRGSAACPYGDLQKDLKWCLKKTACLREDE